VFDPAPGRRRIYHGGSSIATLSSAIGPAYEFAVVPLACATDAEYFLKN
jgi:hypothetical protein